VVLMVVMSTTRETPGSLCDGVDRNLGDRERGIEASPISEL
jgi:hypothetical protein